MRDADSEPAGSPQSDVPSGAVAPSDIDFKFRLSYLEQLDAFLSTPQVRAVFLSCAAIAACALAWIAFGDPTPKTARVILILAVTIGLFVPLVGALMVPSLRGSVPLWWPRQRWVLGDRGVRLEHDARATTERSWSGVRFLGESRRFFHIELVGQGVATAPKRALDQATLQRVRSALQARSDSHAAPVTESATPNLKDAIAVSYDFRVGESVRAFRLLSGKIPAALRSWKGMVALLGLSLPFWWPLGRQLLGRGRPSAADFALGTTDILIGFVGVAVALGVAGLLYGRRLKGQPQTIQLSGNCIWVHAWGFSGRLEWHAIHHVTETRDMFLLFTGKAAGTFIPKRILSGAHQVEQIRQLVRRKVGNKALLLPGEPNQPGRDVIAR